MTNIYVHCFNIRYTGRDKVISVIGSEGLRNFMDKTYRDFYGKGYVDTIDASTAPTDMVLELTVKDDYFDTIDEYYDILKEKIEKKTGISVKSFSYTII